MTELLTTREVATLGGVRVNTVTTWASDAGLPVHSRVGRTLRFDRVEVDKFIASRALGTQAGEAKIADEMGAKVLERFGTSALDKNYEAKVKWSFDTTSPKSPGTPILMLSDIHYGEVVSFEETLQSNRLDIAISEERVKQVFTTSVELLKVHMAVPNYNGMVLILGGDMISGALHEDHLATDEATPIEQALGISRVLADGIAFLADEFPNVTVYCVPGNHGRTTRKPRAKFYAQTNLDWLTYKLVESHCVALANVEIICPPVRDLTFTVAGHRYRLTHGDQFRGGDGIIGPIGPIMRGDTRKRLAANLMPGSQQEYDTMLCGHFHTYISLPRLIVNGSVKGYDEYALSIHAPFELPQQALWITHPKYGHTYTMPILCNNGNPTYEEIIHGDSTSKG